MICKAISRSFLSKIAIYSLLLFSILSADTTQFQRFSGIPVLAYSAETGAQFGAMGMLYLKPFSANDPGGQIDLALIGTTNKQKRAVFTTQYWANNGNWRLEHELEYRDWPASYWQGGNSPLDSVQNYRMNSLCFYTEALRKVNIWRFGALTDLEFNKTRFNESSLETPTNKGGKRMGVGYIAQIDTRNNENWPEKGVLIGYQQTLFLKALGGDWNYSAQKLDLRAFLSGPTLFFDKSAFAFASLWEGVLGRAPFDRLSTPNGTHHLRGLEKGRLSDRQFWVLQSEWRVPLFWRFSGVSFVEAGKVGPHFGELLQNPFHYAFGVGGRLALNQSRKVHVRGDLTWVDKGIGLTVYYKEAF